MQFGELRRKHHSFSLITTAFAQICRVNLCNHKPLGHFMATRGSIVVAIDRKRGVCLGGFEHDCVVAHFVAQDITQVDGVTDRTTHPQYHIALFDG